MKWKWKESDGNEILKKYKYAVHLTICHPSKSGIALFYTQDIGLIFDVVTGNPFLLTDNSLSGVTNWIGPSASSWMLYNTLNH